MARFLITLLGSSKQNCDWHIFTVSILFVRKSFIKIYLSQSQEILSRDFSFPNQHAHASAVVFSTTKLTPCLQVRQPYELEIVRTLKVFYDFSVNFPNIKMLMKKKLKPEIKETRSR